MIEHPYKALDVGSRGHVRERRPLQHDHRNAEPVRRGKLCVSGRAAAVLADDPVDAMGAQKLQLAGFPKWPARNHVVRHRQRKWRLDPVDAADQVMVLRRRLERGHFLPSERQENPARLLAEDCHGLGRIVDHDPAISRPPLPGRAPERHDRNARRAGGRSGIGRDAGRKWMRGIDQNADIMPGQIGRQPCRAAEAAGADRDGLLRRPFSTSGKRQRDVEVAARRETPRELPGLAGAAEDEDAV